MGTKFWYVLCIGAFFCSTLTQAINFTLFTENVDRFQDQMKVVCNQLGSGNLAFAELVLQGLVGVSYGSLIDMPVSEKRDLVNWVRGDFCDPSSKMLPNLDFELYAWSVVDSQRLAQYLLGSLDSLNLAAFEYLQQAFLLQPYEFIINQEFSIKESVIQFLRLIAYSAGAVYSESVAVASLGAGGVSDGGTGSGEGLSGPNPVDYLAVPRGGRGIRLTDNYFCTTIGKPLAETKVCGRTNRVEKSEYPDLNKYNQGIFAIPLVVLENDYRLFKDFIPQSIKTALIGIADENISFYVEISSGNGFYDKGRRYNLIFHGALADWYDADMTAEGFNFATGGFARDLPMGVFEFNPRRLPAEPFELSGIQPGTEGFVRVGEAIAKNGLAPQNVSAHHGRYSPDNAGFIIRDGRHVITFWSVARSDDKARAVVTLHILFDWQLPNNFKDRVLGLSQNMAGVRNVGQLLNGLQELSRFLEAGPDQVVWDESLNYLRQMYGQR